MRSVVLRAEAVESEALEERGGEIARQRLRRCFRRLAATLARYHGRLRESRGDRLAAGFDAAQDAVCAALVFQATQADYLDQIEDGIEPRIRIGIACGGVVQATAAAAGGEVLISGEIRRALSAELAFTFEDLGEQSSGDVDQSARFYGVTLAPGAEVPPPARRRGSKSLQPMSTMRSLNRFLLLAIAVALLYAFLSAS